MVLMGTVLLVGSGSDVDVDVMVLVVVVLVTMVVLIYWWRGWHWRLQWYRRWY